MKIALVNIIGGAGRGCLGVLVLSLVFCLGGFGGEIGPITLVIGETMANVGDTAEIAVSLTSTTNSPASLILSLRYDPLKVAPFTSFFEFTLRDIFTDEPIEDESGNVITQTRAVRLDPGVAALGKTVELDIKGAGFIDILVFGANDTVIPDGPLFTVAFEVLSGSAENETVVLDGLDSDMPVLFEGEEFFSSAGTDDIVSLHIPVVVVDGGVMVGCTEAETPVGLAVGATQSDSVELSWDAVTDPNAEYRVFRSDEPSLVSAVPIGEGWQSATSFSDITAPVPEVIAGAGCFGVPIVTVVPQFYWVKSRVLETGCESAFAEEAVQGFRGAKKINVGAVSASTLPSFSGGGDVVLMGLLVALFVVMGGGRSWLWGKAAG